MSGNYQPMHVAPVGQTNIPNGGCILTRPADTTAYAAADVVAGDPGNLVFKNVILDSDSSRGGYIVRATLTTSQATCTARHRLWLCSEKTSLLSNGEPADNAALDLELDDTSGAAFVVATSGVNDNPPRVLGYIDFPAAIPVGSVAFAEFVGQFHFFTRTTARADDLFAGLEQYVPILFGVLTTLDAYTPDSGQQYWVHLGIERG